MTSPTPLAVNSQGRPESGGNTLALAELNRQIEENMRYRADHMGLWVMSNEEYRSTEAYRAEEDLRARMTVQEPREQRDLGYYGDRPSQAELLSNTPPIYETQRRESIPGHQYPPIEGVNTVQVIGMRVQSNLTEPMVWSGETTKKIKWFYDAPNVEILDQTGFRNLQGNIVDAPQYDRTRGEFFADEAVFGAFIVRYSPEYTLLDVCYDNA